MCQSFWVAGQPTLGHIWVDWKVGPSKEETSFHRLKGETTGAQPGSILFSPKESSPPGPFDLFSDQTTIILRLLPSKTFKERRTAFPSIQTGWEFALKARGSHIVEVLRSYQMLYRSAPSRFPPTANPLFLPLTGRPRVGIPRSEW